MGSVDDLFDLDPDSDRTTSQQIANAVRAAILLGVFAADEKLPSQHELAARYGVARETVKAALRILHGDKLIVSRQGSGVFVRHRQGSTETLTDILRGAFDRPHVSIDYCGFNGETLANTLPPSLHELGTGRLSATTVRLRMLLVDPELLPAMPRAVPQDAQQRSPTRTGPPPDIRRTFGGLLDRSVGRLAAALDELTDRRLVDSTQLEVRVHGLGPSVKLYLLNGERAFFGFYPVTTAAYELGPDRVPTLLHHPSGWDATVFSAADGMSSSIAPIDGDSESRGPISSGPPFTTQARAWFDSLWTTLARSYPITEGSR
ncbi:GntR family transcriptional regulator [Microlunatus soli]|uniref:Regulatory protein, gntR family n=1 Tax=Microlunatus soli TaxID=630515 RepID=A0A1H1Z517_9ACTN|nr:winged helix-turn-helix domain-containing protein [Microlunatus soli]SDT28709.1 regulatory protein, gntR family [Microlunatus soli]